MIVETSQALAAVKPISHGFFARHGGVSEGTFASLNCSFKVGDLHANVQTNRYRALTYLGLNPSKLFIPNLVHGTKAIFLNVDDNVDHIAATDGDALITATSGLVIGITYADCLPVLISSSDGDVVSAIHVGWRGIKGELISIVVKSIQRRFPNRHLIAAIGPAISKDGFKVDEELFISFQNRWPADAYTKLRERFVDLSNIALKQLRNCGILEIEKSGGYTDLDTSKYFSYRRDGGQTGRHLAVIAIN